MSLVGFEALKPWKGPILKVKEATHFKPSRRPLPFLLLWARGEDSRWILSSSHPHPPPHSLSSSFLRCLQSIPSPWDAPSPHISLPPDDNHRRLLAGQPSRRSGPGGEIPGWHGLCLWLFTEASSVSGLKGWLNLNRLLSKEDIQQTHEKMFRHHFH